MWQRARNRSPDIDRLASAVHKGHNAPLAHKFHVFTTGQKRGVIDKIKRQMKRRAPPSRSSAISKTNTG